MNGDAGLSIDEFLDGVIRWITCSSSTSGEENLKGLFSGRLIADALCSIHPDFFTESWYEAFEFDSFDQQETRLKISKQREIVNRIYEYYEEKQGKSIRLLDNWKVDVNKLVDLQNKRELKKVLVLLIGIVMFGEYTSFKKAFNNLEKEMLTEIESCMKMLEFDMNKASDSLPVEHQQELKKIQKENDNLKIQLKELIEEKGSFEVRERDLVVENNRLNQKINESYSANVEKEKLHQQLNRFKGDYNEIEATCNQLEKENRDYCQQIDELTKKNENLKNSVSEFELESRKLRDQNSELHERLKIKETDLNQLRMKTDKDFAREILDKEREIKILEEKCRSYVREIADFESVGRRNESLNKQLAQSNAMFEERSEDLQKAETMFKNEMAKQASRIEELEQHRVLLEAQIHQTRNLHELRCPDPFEASTLEDHTTTSNCSSPSLNEEFTALNINFEESRYYSIVDELKAEKQKLLRENVQLREDYIQKLGDFQAKSDYEKAALKEEISTLHQRLDLYRQAGRLIEGGSSSNICDSPKHTNPNLSQSFCKNSESSHDCKEMNSEIKRLKSENDFLQTKLSKLKTLEEECNQYEFENKLLTSKIYELWLKEVKLDAGHSIPVSTSTLSIDPFPRQSTSRASTSSSSSSTTRSLFTRFRPAGTSDNNSLSLSGSSWLKVLVVTAMGLILLRILAHILNDDEVFTVFGSLPNFMVEYIREPPV